ncbi:hypothetical protein ACGF5S_17425 [Nocardia nova]|uniref:hypothetical protein n=1 Tax=Nocardia nova TaxID=37330 RepID=UPI00371DC0BE
MQMVSARPSRTSIGALRARVLTATELEADTHGQDRRQSTRLLPVLVRIDATTAGSSRRLIAGSTFDAINGPDAGETLLRLEPGVEVTVGNRTWAHDPNDPDPADQFALSRLSDHNARPGTAGKVPIGIFCQVQRPAYDDLARAQVAQAATSVEGSRADRLAALINSGDTWTVR